MGYLAAHAQPDGRGGEGPPCRLVPVAGAGHDVHDQDDAEGDEGGGENGQADVQARAVLLATAQSAENIIQS